MKYALGFLLSISVSISAVQAQAATKADEVQGTSAVTQKKLPYGVEDVLKLSRAQVNEEIIVKYIQNSGTIYNLNPETIVYLKNEGVSDNVVNAMLDQPKNAAAAIGTTSTWISQAPSRLVPQQQVGPAYTAPPQPDPVPAPAPPPPRSSVYVIPYAQATYAWPGYYGSYYGSYYGGPGWYGPRFSLGFGFGFGGHHHHHRGCW